MVLYFPAHLVLESGSSESHSKTQFWSRILSDMFIYNFQVICKNGLIIKNLVEQAFVQDLAEALRCNDSEYGDFVMNN
ncbi:36400_t:CDS:2 [Gigaspora margarita]|uniref:36400_t:CDS:1 n=1 Tax=Gigaspora margarita TaxID=4874 RepID=A0ABN7UIL8_GIGMA|nr:36400_t:CDS:2 [Gigaspora margarita]